MNLLDILQARYDVTLYTYDHPDLKALNAYFNTGVSDIQIRQPKGALKKIVDGLRRLTGRDLTLLCTAVLENYVNKTADPDLVISTINDIKIQHASLHYVHFPKIASIESPQMFPERTLTGGPIERAYNQLYNILSESDSMFNHSSTSILVNSSWTKKMVEKKYAIDADVVYPPIQIDIENVNPWSQREDGFVSIGRISRQKNILRNMEIIERLNEQGHEVHYHIIGNVPDSNYAEEVLERADHLQYVHVEGEVNREELLETLNSHKYGIHGKEFEHFGMAVAEMVEAGVLPFVPDSGGQTEIINEEEYLIYESVNDAVDKISHVLDDDHETEKLRNNVIDPGRYSKERFARKIESHVESQVNHPNS